MVNYSLNFIRLILNHDADTVDVKKSAEVSYTAEMQRACKNTVWQSGCTSCYHTKDGWNTTLWPYSQVDFWRRCAFPKWDDWNITYTKKGIAKMRMRRAVRVLVVVLAVGGLWRLKLSGLRVNDVKGSLRCVLQGGVASVMDFWAIVRNAVLVRGR
jgi:hypothetical protein